MNCLEKFKRSLSRIITGSSVANENFSRIAKPSNPWPASKIVCVSHDAGFYGAQLLILHVAEVLKEQLGFKVTSVLLGDGPLMSKFKLFGDVICFSDPPWRVEAKPDVLQARQKEIKRLFREGARHAICNTSVSGHVLRMLKEEGFQVIALIHELPNLIREYRLESSVKEISQWADAVVFPAEFVRDRFLPIAALDPTHAVIRPQGLYRPSPYRNSKNESKARLITELGLSPTARIVVAAGQGERRKGIDIFCQVAARVIKVMPEVHFVWIGDDTSELAQDCHAWVRSVGIADNMHFTGVLEEPDLYLRHIAGADLYLMTSREDPYPSVVLDAMEAAVPVIGFADAGGFTELLQVGAGILVPYENREAMATAVNELLERTDHATRMGQEGQRIIDTRFNFLDYVYDLLLLVGCPRPKISVVIPNYNYARYLPYRLGSIIAQTYRPYEIIFLDDNSSDESVAVAEAALSKSGLPYRILVNDVNRGCYSQWLLGIEKAKGDLVWIAEADDESETTFLKELVQGFEDPDVVLAYSQSRKIDQDGNITSEHYLDYTDDLSKTKWLSPYKRSGRDEIKDTLAIKNTIPNASAVLMKKPDLSKIRERLLQLKNAGDWLSYAHILESGSIYFTPKVLNMHRVHIGGATRGGNAVQLMSEIIQVQEHLRAHHELTADTVAKIEGMRQFTYEYLGLQQSGGRTYGEHPDLQQALSAASWSVKTPEINPISPGVQS